MYCAKKVECGMMQGISKTVDQSLVLDGWKKYEKDAIINRDEYNNLLSFFLQTRGIQHEADAFSGAFTTLYCRDLERKNKPSVERNIVENLKLLRKRMEKVFMREFKRPSLSLKETIQAMLEKASAWYIVTYQNPNPTFLSFPWVVSNLLARIKSRPSDCILLTISMPLSVRLDIDIRRGVEKNLLPKFPREAEKELLKYNIDEGCQIEVLKSCFRFIMQWAIDMDIIHRRGFCNKGFMFVDKLAKIFFVIARKEGYVSKKSFGQANSSRRRLPKTAADIFFAFLRYCSQLHFCDQVKARNLLTFEVNKNRRLGKTAMQTYHQIAITGSYYLSDHVDEYNVYEMTPEYIECSSNLSLLQDENVWKLKEALENYSEVESLSLRVNNTTKKIIVSACGTQSSLYLLRRVLRKNPDTFANIIGTDAVKS